MKLLFKFCLAFFLFVPTAGERALGTDDDSAVDLSPGSNRWVVIVDTVSQNATKSNDYLNVYDNLQRVLEKAGVPDDHIVVYSQFSSPEFQPTSKNLRDLLAAIQKPDWNEMKSAKAVKTRLRDDGKAELHFYIVAQGVANRDETKQMIIPSDVDSKSLQNTEDPRLISLNEIENAIVECDEENEPIDRSLLIVNFISVQEVVRGSKTDSALRDVDIRKLRRGGFDENGRSGSYSHWRIVTRNQSTLDESPENFYQTLEKGLDGFADISGNRDRIVQASELAEYMKTLGKTSNVELVQNGNDPFPLCRTDKNLQIPDGLFLRLSILFTHDDFRQAKASAVEREKKLNAESTTNNGSATNAKPAANDEQAANAEQITNY